MVIEIEFLRREELPILDRELIDQVAFPVGDRYPQEIFDNYFAWYYALVQKFRPRRMLEIGVRYGYTAIYACHAALQTGDSFEYLGLDDESYPPAPGVSVGSCTKANQNFLEVGFREQCRAMKWNSFNGLPPDCGTFDLIHIDGNHDFGGVWNDLGYCWPVLNVGGFIILDDVQFPQIKSAIDQWLEAHMGLEEVVAIQFIEDERGHCLIRKTGLAGGDMSKCPFDFSDPAVALR